MCGGATAVHTTSTANRCVRALCRLHIREILADASFRFYLGPMGGCVADGLWEMGDRSVRIGSPMPLGVERWCAIIIITAQVYYTALSSDLGWLYWSRLQTRCFTVII